MAAKVQVVGAARKIEQINRFDKELWKEIQRGVRDALGSLVSDAKSSYPDTGLTNWGQWTAGSRDLSYQAGAVRAGVRPAFRSKNVSGVRLISGNVSNRNPAGAIFGLAGSRDRTGHPFNTNINNSHGSGGRGSGVWPRVLTPAWTRNVEQARRDIAKVVEAAIDQVNR